MEVTMKPVKTKKEAVELAAKKKGYYEGPFVDDKLNNTYYVFWNEKAGE